MNLLFYHTTRAYGKFLWRKIIEKVDTKFDIHEKNGNHLKTDCINESLLNGIRKSVLFCFSSLINQEDAKM